MNISNRCKNIFFWLGIIGTIFSAAKIDIQTMTSWSLLIDALKNIIMNPIMLLSVIAAIVGVFVDPSTPGFKDKTE